MARRIILISFIISQISLNGQNLSEEALLSDIKYYDTIRTLNQLEVSDINKLLAINSKTKKHNYYDAYILSTKVLMNIYYSKYELDSSIIYSYKIINHDHASDHLKSIAYRNIGRTEALKSNTKNAIKNYLMAEALYDKLNQDKQTTHKNEILNLFSFTEELIKIKDFDRAFDKLNKIAYRVNHFNYKDSLLFKALEYEYKGSIEATKNNFRKSIQHFNSSYNYHKKINNKIGMYVCYGNIGVNFYKLKEFDSSFYYSSRTFEWFNKSNYTVFIPESSYYYAKNLIEKGELFESLKYFNICIETAKKVNDYEYYFNSILEKSKILAKKNRRGEIESLLRKTINDSIFINAKNKDLYYIELLKFYSKKNSKVLGLVEEYKKNYFQSKLKEEIDYRNKIEEIYNFHNVLDSLNTTKLTVENLKQARKVQSRNMIFLITTAIVVLTLILILLYNQRKVNNLIKKQAIIKDKLYQERKQYNEQLLEHKKKKIVDFAIHIDEKNDILETIKKKLKTIKFNSGEQQSQFLQINSFITESIEQNNAQISFYKNIDNLNSGFITKINSKFPNLNKQEQKIIMLLRMGMNSKQIATQMNISTPSVQNYRYTIRKKMNLKREESLRKAIEAI